MLKNLDIFDVEEQEVLNRAVQNADAKTITREDVLKRLDFVLAINADADIADLYEGLKTKVLNLDDEEWGQIRELLPFQLLYSDEDREPSDLERESA